MKSESMGGIFIPKFFEVGEFHIDKLLFNAERNSFNL
jgi:hypothetical protein